MSDKPCSRENGFRVECIKHYADIEVELDRLKGRVIALEAQLESEKAAYKALRASSFVTAVPSEEYEKLKAEVERLRKWMDDISLQLDSGLNVGWTLLKIKQEYNAAKEGKPQS